MASGWTGRLWSWASNVRRDAGIAAAGAGKACFSRTTIWRRAYGFGDFRYFTLKILDATGALPPLETLDYPQF